MIKKGNKRLLECILLEQGKVTQNDGQAGIGPQGCPKCDRARLEKHQGTSVVGSAAGLT